MAKKQAASQPKRKRGRGADPEETRNALVDAALSSLLEEGFRGTTARSIAGRADCNQAAIYYHFGGIDQLLLVALQQSSERRLERYRSAVHDVTDLQGLVQKLEALYKEDRETGQLAVLTELVGGITANPELRDGIDLATRPWLDFVEEKIRAAAPKLPMGIALPADDVADIIFSLVVGVELRNKIDGDQQRADRLWRMAALAAGLVSSQ